MAKETGFAELARLMETFNQATEKLTRSYHTIAELQSQIAEKDRALSKKTRLEMLGQMAAALAHEIRNPLGGMQLYANLLRRDLEGDAERRKFVDRILGGIAVLSRLVDDMLTYGGNLDPQKTPTSLSAVIDEALAFAQPSLEEKHIHVLREGTSDPVSIDATMIQRVLLNLVLNAVQAMESEGTLTIRQEPGRILVSDTGPGIPPAMMEKLFTPFVTDKAKGTGLGLAIAQRIVEAHGGSIEVRNNPGRGAMFIVHVKAQNHGTNPGR